MVECLVLDGAQIKAEIIAVLGKLDAPRLICRRNRQGEKQDCENSRQNPDGKRHDNLPRPNRIGPAKSMFRAPCMYDF